jgi:hypothetical protein
MKQPGSTVGDPIGTPLEIMFYLILFAIPVILNKITNLLGIFAYRGHMLLGFYTILTVYLIQVKAINLNKL